MDEDDHVSLYLWTVLLAFICSALGQFFLDGSLASNGAWKHASGWQNEIAIWNIALAAIIIGALLYKDWQTNQIIAIGVMILTALLGLNHLWSYVRTDVPWWHLVLAIMNLVGTVWGGALWYWWSRPYRLI